MANGNENNRQQVDPTLVVVGIGNKNGAALMQQGVAADPLPQKVGGMNVIKVDGINGKGEHKEYGANPMTQEVKLVAASSQIAKAVVVGKTSVDAKRFVFQDPENENAKLHIIYDVRNTEKPAAIFRKSVQEVDGKKQLVTEKLTDTEVVLVPKGNYTKEDLGKILAGLVDAINSKSIGGASTVKIIAELKKKNLLAPKKISEIFDFIKVFDENLSPTEENIKALKIKLHIDHGIAVPEEGYANLSSVYNPMTLNGISIATLQNASDISQLINGEIQNPEALSAGEKAFMEFAQKKELTAVALVEAQTIFGVDANSNIVVIEDSNVPYKANGEIAAKILEKKIAEAKKARNVIDASFWARASKIDPNKYPREDGHKEYNDAEIAQAEKILQNEAEKYIKFMGESSEKGLSEILAKQEPIVTLMASNNIEKMQQAQNAARDLMAVVRAGAFKQSIQNDPTLIVENGYIATNDQGEQYQRGQANSSPKQPLRADFKAGERVVTVLADIPKLIKTKGEDSVVNLKTTKMPVFEVLINKDGKAIDLQAVNTFGAWAKQQKVGRVLKTLMDLKGDDEKLEKKFKDLINYGGKINDKNTDFGLGAALKDSDDQIAQFFKDTLADIRSTVYPDGQEQFTETTLEAVQEKISNLVESEDYSVRNLGKQVVALQARSENLEDYFGRRGVRTLMGRRADRQEKRDHLKDVMLRILNDEEVLPTKGATLSIAKTAAVIKAFIDPVRKNINETALSVATDMGFKHDDFKRGHILQKTKNGEHYIRAGYYNENIIPAKKENIETIIGKAAGADAGIDLDAARVTMETLQSYYNENKEVYVRKTSLYMEDEEIGAGIGVNGDLDVDLDPELAKALEEIASTTEADTVVAPDTDDIEAEMEESGEITQEAIEEMPIDLDMDGTDPHTLFGDDLDPEEEAPQVVSADEEEAVTQAQSMQVEV